MAVSETIISETNNNMSVAGNFKPFRSKCNFPHISFHEFPCRPPVTNQLPGTKPAGVGGSLCGVLAQLLVSHEELLPLSEGLAHRVALVDGLDGGGGDVLDGRDGQRAVLQHELGHLAVASQQGVVQRGVPASGAAFMHLLFELLPSGT